MRGENFCESFYGNTTRVVQSLLQWTSPEIQPGQNLGLENVVFFSWGEQKISLHLPCDSSRGQPHGERKEGKRGEGEGEKKSGQKVALWSSGQSGRISGAAHYLQCITVSSLPLTFVDGLESLATRHVSQAAHLRHRCVRLPLEPVDLLAALPVMRVHVLEA